MNTSVSADTPKGSIVVVGPGIMLGAHLPPRSRNYIEKADIVFSCCPPIINRWLETLNPNFNSLLDLYGEGKVRSQTYQEMVDAMMAAVRDGLKVVAVYYGHPGVFAWSPHKVIEVAKSEGYAAHMEPGISADACLYADMGIDPGQFGCQSFEASAFMFYRPRYEPASYLILWQPALAGELSITTQHSNAAQRQVLVELLLEDYPSGHQIAIYEAPFLPLDKPRIDWFALEDFANQRLTMNSTLVIPPAKKMQVDKTVLEKLKRLQQQV